MASCRQDSSVHLGQSGVAMRMGRGKATRCDERGVVWTSRSTKEERGGQPNREDALAGMAHAPRACGLSD
jgi:hypothetical protein